MSRAEQYTLGGLCLDVCIDSYIRIAPSAKVLEMAFQWKNGDECTDDNRVTMRFCGDGTILDAGSLIFSQTTSRYYQDDSSVIIQRFALNQDGSPWLSIEVDLHATEFTFHFDIDRYAQCFHEQQRTINVFDIATQQTLLHPTLFAYQGLAIHGAGGSIGGKGLVFAAPSGTGKSTLAQLLLRSPDSRMFSEERMIVRRQSGGWNAWGTPWPGSGTIACNEQAELSAIVFLRQAQQTAIVPLTPSLGLKRLLQVTCIPWYSAEWTHKGLKLCEQLLQEIPMYELGFTPDDSAVRAVEKLTEDVL